MRIIEPLKPLKMRVVEPLEYKEEQRPFMTPMQYRIVGGIVVIISIAILDVLFRLF